MNLILFLLPLSTFGQYVLDLSTCDFTTKSVELPGKKVEYIENGIIVTYEISTVGLFEDDLFPGSYHFSIPGFSEWTEAGLPAILNCVNSFVIPPGSKPKIELISSNYVDLNYKVAPSRVPKFVDDTVAYSIYNITQIKPYSGFWPENTYEEMEIDNYRNQNIINIGITPLMYDYSANKTRIYTKLQYKIDYSDSNIQSTIYYEPGSLLNPSCSLKTDGSRMTRIDTPGSSIKADAGYIILSVSEFKDILQEFVSWKKLLGYNVIEIYRDNWDSAESVKNAIKEQYENDNTILYLLIVGSNEKIPAFSIEYGSDAPILTKETHYITDFPFSCMGDEKDTFAELYCGRWPINNSFDLQTIIDNTIWYEHAPTTRESFYNHATHFSFFDDKNHDGIEDGRMVKTSEDVREYVQDKHDILVDRFYSIDSKDRENWPSGWNVYETRSAPFPDELLHENFDWNAKPTDIVNAIDEGRLYLLYEGHGHHTEWAYGNNQIFGSEYLQNMRNYDEFPLVFSICCNTGDHAKQDCFARHILTNKIGGTFAIFAATGGALSIQDPKYTSLLINEIWPLPGFSLQSHRNYDLTNYFEWNTPYPLEPIRQLGPMLNFATRCFKTFSSEFLSLYPKHIYHLFGDPSVYFKAEVPQVLNNIDIQRGNQGTHVFVSDTNAYIAFYDPIRNHSERHFGNEASYFTNCENGAKYVNVMVYTEKDIPYIDLGERYYGYIEETPQNNTSILGYRDTHDGSVEIDYWLSEENANNSTLEIQIVNPINGNIISSCPLDRTITDQKATVRIRCAGGVMIAYLMAGSPVSSMKMYISK